MPPAQQQVAAHGQQNGLGLNENGGIAQIQGQPYDPVQNMAAFHQVPQIQELDAVSHNLDDTQPYIEEEQEG